MKQLNVPDEIKIVIDFEDDHVPESVKTFRPVLFKDGDTFCCVLGPNAQEGVFGSGNTVPAAMKDWDKQLQKRMEVNDKDDEVAMFIHRIIDPDGDG